MKIKKYEFGDTVVQYLLDDNKKICMMLIPKRIYDEVQKPWEKENSKFDPKARYMHNWKMGSLVHFYSSDYDLSYPGITMKSDMVDDDLFFDKQTEETENDKTTIKTFLTTSKGYKVVHKLSCFESRKGFEVETEFLNESEHECDLQMLTSFSLDNLSPFQQDDAPGKYYLHKFYGGWSLEGKHVCTSVEDLSLEKSWAGFLGPSEKFGSIGSYPVERYFPTAVFEDRENKVFWAVQLANNST